jgi:KDO2-lipid IV(A) lauroyltransferase
MNYMITLAKETGLWFVWFPLRSILKHLPIRLLYAAADVFSPLYCLLSKKRRVLVTEEVRRLYGDRYNKKELESVVKRSFRIHAKRQLENVFFGQLTKEKLDRIVSIQGFDHLQQVLQKNNGAILLLAHFGSFLLPLPVLGFKGYKVMQLGGKPLIEGTRPIHKKIFELRKNETDKMPFQFSRADQYLGSVVRALKNNEIVVIAFDGRTGSKWIPVPLINRIAEFSPGPFNLAIKTGAAILPTFVVRGRDNNHTIVFEPPMDLEITENQEDARKKSTERYSKIFERYLLRYPCHFASILYSVRQEAQRGLNRPLFID